MGKPVINLMVLRVADLVSARAFYEVLGLAFVQEQHGSGPIHFSCERGGMVLELYPGKPGQAPERLNAGATMLGFSVESVETTLVKLNALNVTVVTEPKESPWGKRMVVLDPDGRTIEISEPPRKT
ncbi:MAG TPA: VOC family protein [Verrucomicrobiae bacterium]